MKIKYMTLSLFAFCLFALSVSSSPALSAAVPDPSFLLLNNSRFRVTVDYANFPGNDFSLQPSTHNGQGLAIQLTNETGYFYFPNDRGTKNVDVIVKILNGCPVNSHFWMFAAGTTNYAVTIIITDTVTNQTKTYHNPAGNFFPPIMDTSAFDGCGSGAPSLAEEPSALTRNVSGAALENLPAPGTCSPLDTRLCLLQNRFRVQVDWELSNGMTGRGHAVPVAETDESGLFWNFDSQNLELVVKIIDGRSANGHFWVFVSAMTDIKYTVTIIDKLTDEARFYSNPQGQIPDTVGDNHAFGPGAEIPTLNEWGMIFLGLLLAFLSLRVIPKRSGDV